MLNWILKLMPYKETTEWLADLNQAMRGSSNVLELTEKQLQSFTNLQEATFHLDTLVHPRWDKPFTLHVDASKKDTFAILSQEHGIISYRHHVFLDTESRWAPTEQECYAIVKGILQNRDFLLAVPFILKTDHKALTYLLKKRFKNAKVWRWTQLLEEYVFQVDYLPGDGHPSDYGSRFILLQQEEFVLHGKRVAVDELYNHLAIFDQAPREKKECKRFMNKYHLRWSEIEVSYKIVDFR